MSQDEKFYAKYKPIKNTLVEDAPFDGCMFETFGDEIQEVLKYARDEAKHKQVWTLVDCEGLMYLVAGYSLVNRMGYIITEEPWDSQEEQYLMDSLGDETYYFAKCDFDTDEDWYDLIHKHHELPSFHDLFDGEDYKPEYAEFFDEEADIELIHTCISVSNKDTLENLLESMRLTEDLKQVITNSVTSRFFKVIGIVGGIRVENYLTFDDMVSETNGESVEVQFSNYE